MNLSARLARMEARGHSYSRHIQIAVAYPADADRQIEDALLSAGPGPIAMTVTIGGHVVLQERWNLLPHEDRLEQLEHGFHREGLLFASTGRLGTASHHS